MGTEAALLFGLDWLLFFLKVARCAALRLTSFGQQVD